MYYIFDNNFDYSSNDFSIAYFFMVRNSHD